MRIALFSLLWLLFASCSVTSKTALEGSGGRNAYNLVLQATNSEQMLLNLIRLRFFDSPYFLDVDSITTQFTYRTSVAPKIPIPGFNRNNPFTIGGDFSWTSQPTIQFTPLEGQDFAKQLLTPIDLKTIQQLILSGWDIDLIFKIVIQSFDEFLNAPEAAAPIPEYAPRYEQFFEVTKLLRYFQMRSALKVGVKCCPKIEPSQAQVNSGESKEILQLAFPEGDTESEKLASFFSDVHKSEGHYVVNLELGYNSHGKIGIIPRSILSSMYYLSLGIDVPEEDIKKHHVVETLAETGEPFDWKRIIGELIEVKSSGQEPKSSYISVKYKDSWYYIEDSDILSKRTFLLLLQLYNLQAKESKMPPPILTLPIGNL